MSDPNEHLPAVGYLITFRCYGTWLHGDERGSVDRQNNQLGAPLLEPNSFRQRAARQLMKQPPIALDTASRQVVEDAVRKVCAFRGWVLHSVEARTNHVHAVVSAASATPERVMNDLKSRSTRNLVTAGIIAQGVKPWEQHGSTIYLWNEEEVLRACRYVMEGQGGELSAREAIQGPSVRPTQTEPRPGGSGVA